MTRFNTAVGEMAALSLGLGITNEVSLPHHVQNGFKNVVALALEAEEHECAHRLDGNQHLLRC